jgi:16S rRNA (cytidine1402-2'-O)-methyltransferase
MLYFVGTPIGNLKDISFRAIEVLKSVDEIACEDTRHSLGLLNAYEIKKPLFSYHKFNEKEVAEKIIEKLKNGKDIAVISDAGMPVISDPGNILAEELVKNGLEFTVIPGASACLSALVLSGLDASRFCFLGFLPEKNKERKEFLERYQNLDVTLIFYCAPHNIKKDIESIYSVFGERTAVAVKEITKIHEEVIKTDLVSAAEKYSKEALKGEIVIIVGGAPDEEEEKMTLEQAAEYAKSLVADGESKSDAAKIAAKECGFKKGDIYKILIQED